MDMVLVRQEARKLGRLRGDIKKNRHSEVMPDIFIAPTQTFTFIRTIPVPLRDRFGRARQDKGNNYLWTHIPLTIYVPAFNHSQAVRLVNGGGGIYERLLDREWMGFPYRSRPWRPDRDEKISFRFTPDHDEDELVEDLG